MKNKINIKKYIPNILTTLRLLVVPVFWIQFLTGNFGIATIIFASACITDAIDGNLARRWKVESRYGKIVDPIADKTLVMSALLLYSFKINPIMFLSLGIESAIAMTNIRAFIKRANLSDLETKNPKDIINFIIKNGNGNVNQIGRKKTVGLMTEVSIALFTAALGIPATKLVNLLTLSTATLQSATLLEYIEQNNGEFNDSSNSIKSHSQEENVESYENVKTKKEEISKQERLKKELEFLTENSNENKKVKTKKIFTKS